MVYQALNIDIASLIPKHAYSILDIGCGNGALGHWLKEQREVLIHGITHTEVEAKQALLAYDNVWVRDLTNFDFGELGIMYDCIVCSHVLEHLIDPWQVVARLVAALNPEGTLLIAIPNVLFFKQRFQFLFGKFRYTKGGIMDATHLRFFDWHSIDSLVVSPSLMLVQKKGVGKFPLPIIRRLFPSIANWVDLQATRIAPGWFSFQMILVCHKRH